MSTSLSTYYGGELVLPSDARRASRAISRSQTCGQVRLARVDIETDVAIAKAEAETSLIGTAMSAVVRVAKAQQQLEALAAGSLRPPGLPGRRAHTRHG